MNIQRRCAHKAGRVKGELVGVIATPTRATNTEAETETETEGATKSRDSR